jgi:hypothetical protein
MDLPKRTCDRTTRGLCGHCISDHQHRVRPGCTSARNWLDSKPRDIACTRKKTKKSTQKIRGAVASDWQDYYGSSDALSKDIERLGQDRFRREILYYCRSKAEWQLHRSSRAVLKTSVGVGSLLQRTYPSESTRFAYYQRNYTE